MKGLIINLAHINNNSGLESVLIKRLYDFMVFDPTGISKLEILMIKRDPDKLVVNNTVYDYLIQMFDNCS